MNYYSTNDVYSRLDKLANHRFVWVAGNAWMLIYGDKYANAKAIVFVFGSSVRKGAPRETERTEQSSILARKLAMGRRIPFHIIEYNDEADAIDSVMLDGEQVSLEALKRKFDEIGLPVREGSVVKAINSQGSSAYHQWQRDSLGAITVSDIDLVRMDDSLSKPIEFIELKRSFKSVSEWNPYPQDFPNFNLIVDVASKVGSNFTIAYNYHVKKPHYVDDASKLSLFEYPSVSGGARHLGVFSFNQFVAGDHLERSSQL
ncbi:hypothetical protein NJI34_41710 [Pseudomonas sp. S 311-6]|nr:hypothetical protein [Pseudomonas sp. S 311-6]